jgi:imidazolonepropionase-like amidohydrolase
MQMLCAPLLAVGVWAGAQGLSSASSSPLLLPDQRLTVPAAETTVFIRVNVIPMDRERILWRRAVVVANGVVVQLGSVDSVAVPKGARIIDAGDSLFLMPGLADMHVHLRYESDLPLLLANGITTVRNMRGTPWHLELRRRIASGALLGPRIVTAGPIFYGYRGAGANPAEARALVDSQSAAGYDFVKVYDRLPQSSYAAVVQEARAAGLPVAGHVPGGGASGTGVAQALQYRQASIEHAEQFVYHYFGDDLDRTRIALLAKEVRAAGSAVTPTLVTISALIGQWEQHDSVLGRSTMRYVEPETYAWWKGDRGHSSALNRTMLPFLEAVVRGFRDAGVPIMAGTDFYLFGVVAGFSLHDELGALVQAGLTPFEALTAATRTPAEFLGDSAHSGTVAIGKSADLLLLSANPLLDIRNSTRIAGVMTRGRWLPRSELTQLVDSLARRFAPEQRLVDEWLTQGSDAPSLKLGTSLPTVSDATIAQVVQDLTRDKRNRDAISVASLGTRAHAQSANAWLTLSDAYLANADTTDARLAIAHVLTIDPRNAKALEMRGSLGRLPK